MIGGISKGMIGLIVAIILGIVIFNLVCIMLYFAFAITKFKIDEHRNKIKLTACSSKQ